VIIISMEKHIKPAQETRYTIYKENGIIYAIYGKDVVVDIEFMHDIIEERIALAEGISCPIFIDCTGVKYWTLEARKYGSSERAVLDASAYAVVFNSVIHKIILNWAIKFYPTKGAPQRIFTDRDKALQWLEQFKR